MPRRVYAFLAVAGLGLAVALPELHRRLEGEDVDERNLTQAGGRRVRMPEGVSAGGSRWRLLDQETVLVTHLSSQWDHSASAEAAARALLARVRGLPRRRILHLRGLTPLAERLRLAGKDAEGGERYFDHPPRVPGETASGMGYPDPYLTDHSDPIPWSDSFERGVFSQGGGFFERQEGAILPLDPRHERYMDRAIRIPAGERRFLVLGGWFHACLTSTIKDLVLDGMVEDGERRIDVLLPARAIFVNRPGPDGRPGSVTLAQALEATPAEGREAFFAGRLDAIDRYVSRKAGVRPGVLFVHQGRGYSLDSVAGPPRVFVWVLDEDPE